MLQRAASNAYTWWWASHIRTKQSKWLDNDLQEMEERVKATIKLIDEDADSFAKKAEMYFKRRPELINSVEEAYRAYKSLADRYDRISRELHKANHTIATAMPDHVPLMEEDDDDMPPHLNPPRDVSKLPKPPPELPRISSRHKKPEAPKNRSPQHKKSISNITREEAQKEIDRLQKSILVMQTEKEFFKSSYERGLAKYWDIEREMTGIQEEISTIQDEFNTRSVIEDDEARALMAATAFKSCEDSLVTLREQQKISVGEARFESERIKVAKEKLRALKGEETDRDVETSSDSSSMEEEVENLKHERLELQSICEKVKELFVMSPESSIAELAEKIDELVEKVIKLEITVSSQTAQILSLRAETDELHKQLHAVEEDKKNFNVDPNSMNERLNQVELQLQRILDLERKVHDEKGAVQSDFAEACSSLNDLSKKLQTPTENNSNSNTRQSKEMRGVALALAAKNIEEIEKIVEKVYNKDDSDQNDENEEISEWQELVSSGMEGRDKILLYEYTSIIQNYKETRKRLMEMEKKSQDYHSETMQQLQELRCANAIKDEEIKALRRKLFSAESLRKSSMKKPENSQKLEDLIANVDDAGPEALDPIAEEEIKQCNPDQLFTTSPLEEKFRGEIDTLLGENLDFWLKFSTSYHQIQKFQMAFKELQVEAEKEIKDRDSGVVSVSAEIKKSSDHLPTDKKLREFNTELQVWLEHIGLLQGELRSRFDSLCSIQDEIARVTKSNEDDEVKFTPYQAAKFQGEVINMQQENNKVAKELQAGLDHVKGLQVEVGKALSRLQEKFELSSSKAPTHQYNQFRHFSTKSRVPLKTFLFAAKPKKPSIFACMNPVYHHRHHIDTKGGKMPKAPH